MKAQSLSLSCSFPLSWRGHLVSLPLREASGGKPIINQIFPKISDPERPAGNEAKRPWGCFPKGHFRTVWQLIGAVHTGDLDYEYFHSQSELFKYTLIQIKVIFRLLLNLTIQVDMASVRADIFHGSGYQKKINIAYLILWRRRSYIAKWSR